MKNNKKHRVYFFDYLWWLGEKEHEKYPHGKMEGSDMCVSYVFGFVFAPMIFLLLYVFPNSKNLVIVVLISFILIYLLLGRRLYKRAYPEERRKAIMNRFANCKFSSTRAYVVMLFPLFLVMAYLFIGIVVIKHNKPAPQITPDAGFENIHRLRELIKEDSALIHQPGRFRNNGEQ
ncbi:MAG: hypothetical protein K2H60_14905 [Muribaculaceae bacterium]|nr:hypothetical protein [Muribaculaceae bacterium]